MAADEDEVDVDNKEGGLFQVRDCSRKSRPSSPLFLRSSDAGADDGAG